MVQQVEDKKTADNGKERIKQIKEKAFKCR